MLKWWWKRLWCKHKWFICRKVSSGFQVLGGEQLYQVCEKCGKSKKYMWLEYEGMGYK